jgi:DHA1 family bicyclomycin/chloramphenicol resistance-like MFS transporter
VARHLRVYGLSPRTFSLVFLTGSLGLLLGVQVAGALSHTVGAERVLAAAAALTLLAAASIVPVQRAGAGTAGLLVCLWVLLAGCGASFPCAEAVALGGQGEQPGTAASLHGCVTSTAAALAAPVAGLVGITDAAPVAAVLLVTSLVSLLGAATLLRLVAGRDAGRLRSHPGPLHLGRGGWAARWVARKRRKPSSRKARAALLIGAQGTTRSKPWKAPG